MPRASDNNTLLWLGFLAGGAALLSRRKPSAPIVDDYSPWRGLHNRNPLNLKISNADWLGEIPETHNTDGTFEQFNAFWFGYRAALKNMAYYVDSGRIPDFTPVDIITLWDGPADQTNWNYVNYVVDRYNELTGDNLTPQTPLPDFRSLSYFSAKQKWWPFIQAMAEFENGTDADYAIRSTRPEFEQAVADLTS